MPRLLHYYLLFVLGAVVWEAMLVAMLVAWAIQGHPDRYWFMDFDKTMKPVYILDIGATLLKPLFAVGAGVQGALVVAGVVAHLRMRTHAKQRLLPYVLRHQVRMHWASVVTCTIGELGILFTAVFDTNNYSKVHLKMVALFIVFMFLTFVMDMVSNGIFIHHYRRQPAGNNPTRRILTVLAAKCVWMLGALATTIGFVACMKNHKRSLAARFEWSILFLYGLYVLLWALDAYPAPNPWWVGDKHRGGLSHSHSHSDESVSQPDGGV